VNKTEIAYISSFLFQFSTFERSRKMRNTSSRIPRRDFFRKSTAATAAVAAGSLVTNADLDSVSAQVNTNSSPTDLKITDMRLALIGNQYILRLDTNQGLIGWGELHASSSKTYALMLKSRILGMNPCNVDQIFRKIKQLDPEAFISMGSVMGVYGQGFDKIKL